MKPRLMIAITLTLSTLSMLSLPVRAEWEYVASSDFYAHYIDPTSARREGEIINVLEVDDKAEQDRYGVYSVRAQTEYDCAGRTYRIANLSGHSKRQTEGSIIFSRPMREGWKPVAPGSLAEATLNRLCAGPGDAS